MRVKYRYCGFIFCDNSIYQNVYDFKKYGVCFKKKQPFNFSLNKFNLTIGVILKTEMKYSSQIASMY